MNPADYRECLDSARVNVKVADVPERLRPMMADCERVGWVKIVSRRTPMPPPEEWQEWPERSAVLVRVGDEILVSGRWENVAATFDRYPAGHSFDVGPVGGPTRRFTPPPDAKLAVRERPVQLEWEIYDLTSEGLKVLLGLPVVHTTGEQPTADDGEYVLVSVLSKDRSEFREVRDATRYLDKLPNEPAPGGIRNRREGQRRLVHEADWHRHFRERDRQASEALDGEAFNEQLADIEARKAEEHKRKQGK